MNAAQRRLYLLGRPEGNGKPRIVGWLDVRNVLITLGGDSLKEADAKRHEIHKDALGKDKSSKDFTNKELDRVLDAFASYVIGAPNSRRAVEQPILRAIKGIEITAEKAGFEEAYITAIARDKFGVEDWRVLPESKLKQLSVTLTHRARSKASKD